MDVQKKDSRKGHEISEINKTKDNFSRMEHQGTLTFVSKLRLLKKLTVLKILALNLNKKPIISRILEKKTLNLIEKLVWETREMKTLSKQPRRTMINFNTLKLNFRTTDGKNFGST